MKKIIFLLSLLCLPGFQIFSQTGFICGEMPTSIASSSDPDEILYDRFGNTYDIVSQTAASGGGVVPCPSPNEILMNYDVVQVEYFEVRYTLGFDDQFATSQTADDFKVRFQAVLEDVADLITPGNLCNPPENGPNIILEVGICELGQGVAATGSSFYPSENSSCPLDGVEYVNSVFESSFLVGYNPQNLPSGRILFNEDLLDDFYLDADLPLDPITDPPLDLHSVALHELMHVFGFASTFQSIQSGGNISSWDLLLGTVEQYDGSGNQMSSELFENDCLGESPCYHLTIGTVTDLENLLAVNCDASNGQTVVIGDGTAPIVGQYPNASLQNQLSHLLNTCDNNGSNDFVMLPEYGPHEFL